MINSLSKVNFPKQTRVRVCGLLVKDDSLLLLKHTGLGQSGFIWSPPGGGVKFGETVKEALIREFNEEVNLEIEVHEFLFANEYMDSKFHALELFFEVSYIQGTLKLGSDPEYSHKNQIIKEAKYLKWEELNEMDLSIKHNAFRFVNSPNEILNLRGFYQFQNIW